MTYPIIKVDDDRDNLEQLGTKEKFWFCGTKKLCKIGRPDTGENWAEKATSEIAKLLKIPCAKYELAIWKNKECVISYNFVPDHGRLIHGNELLFFSDQDYQKDKKYKLKQYKLSTVVSLLKHTSTQTEFKLPKGYEENNSIKTQVDMFIAYLMFDCLVANPDRHHENWGIILGSKEKKYYLAPTYDHASGLGCRVSDVERKRRMSAGKDTRYSVSSFVQRAKTPFYDEAGERLKLLEAFVNIAKNNKIAANYWLDILEDISEGSLRSIFENIPRSLISCTAIDFAVTILMVNKERLLKTRNSLSL
jgi:HipA-like C-terminal domain